MVKTIRVGMVHNLVKEKVGRFDSIYDSLYEEGLYENNVFEDLLNIHTDSDMKLTRESLESFIKVWRMEMRDNHKTYDLMEVMDEFRLCFENTVVVTLSDAVYRDGLQKFGENLIYSNLMFYRPGEPTGRAFIYREESDIQELHKFLYP